jgi:ribosome-associated translation inhibitor RaiA
MEGKNTPIVPHLLARVAERLKQLNTPYADIFAARVTLGQQAGQYMARVRLFLAGKTLHSMQHGASPDAAIGAALWGVAHALYKVRIRQRPPSVPPPHRQNAR